jgi:holliday junction DNA helicase RuvA
VIARLRGILIDRRGGHIVIDCNGVGYEVICSGYTLASLPEIDQQVTLRVFTHATENKIALFGFGGAAERDLFDLLITVKNVGPTSAMGILSGGAGPADLSRLIADGQVAALTRIKGVGKKTAELLVVELREKCEMLLLSWSAEGIAAGVGPTTRPSALPAGAPRNQRPKLVDDVFNALVQMGWRPAEAEKVVSEPTFVDQAISSSASLETLLRQALRAMPR